MKSFFRPPPYLPLNVVIAGAQSAKYAAMDQVETNANEEWREYMLDRTREVAMTHRRLTSDDVYDRYHAMPDPKPRTHEPRAMGPVFMRAAKAGYIKKSLIPAMASRRRSLHASPRTVWDSLIYEEGYVLP